ncbi:uncharacterized protein BDZ99DRAFT_356200, partial [Mytilinidion resinicola]
IRPPYSMDKMMEKAIHQEVINFWKFASGETHKYYDFGSVRDPDNWVIRWSLWHVFRYGSSNKRR